MPFRQEVMAGLSDISTPYLDFVLRLPASRSVNQPVSTQYQERHAKLASGSTPASAVDFNCPGELSQCIELLNSKVC